MSSERDIYVLVPDASRTALLVEDRKLPCVRGGPGAAGAIEAIRGAWALDPPYLRPARAVRDDPESWPVATLHEFDAPPAGWEPRAGLSWLELDEADPAALARPEFAEPIEQWLAIARGAPVPESRAPWARPGWFAEASSWFDRRLAESSLRRVAPIEVVEQWPLSSVLRCEADGGRVYLKAVFSIFRHEPALTAALAARHPSLVTEIISVEEARGLMLMRELRGAQLGDMDAGGWGAVLPAVARIQLDWVGRADELRTLGAHDRTLSALASEIRATFEALEVEVEAGEEMLRELERRCAALAGGPIPETLVHGDLHPWNVMVDGDELRIFDWSDACLSHPFFDLPTFLDRVPEEGAREAMLDAYLAVWEGLASPEGLQAAYHLSRPLACVHHAISYRRIGEAFEPADRWWFSGEPSRWLSRAAELLES